GLEHALELQGLDHGRADAVLHRADRVEELQLGQDLALGLQRPRQVGQADQGRVADGVDDGVVDLAAALALVVGGIVGGGGVHGGFLNFGGDFTGNLRAPYGFVL